MISISYLFEKREYTSDETKKLRGYSDQNSAWSMDLIANRMSGKQKAAVKKGARNLHDRAQKKSRNSFAVALMKNKKSAEEMITGKKPTKTRFIKLPPKRIPRANVPRLKLVA